MKRIAWLFLVIVGSVIFTHAQSSANQVNQNGTVCNSACVTQVDNLSTCDRDCTDKSGPAVLVNDQGQVTKVAGEDQHMYPSYMGTHVKMPTIPTETESEREQSLRISKIEASTP
jgi:hypothetical protein